MIFILNNSVFQHNYGKTIYWDTIHFILQSSFMVTQLSIASFPLWEIHFFCDNRQQSWEGNHQKQLFFILNWEQLIIIGNLRRVDWIFERSEKSVQPVVFSWMYSCCDHNERLLLRSFHAALSIWNPSFPISFTIIK